MKILIVDDHPLILEGLRQLLMGRYPHAQLVLAATGAQAIDLLVPHRDIDLVLLDYKLPDITGLEVLREFARVRAKLAVLVVSGSTNPHLMQQTINAGALGFVLKSDSIDEMFKAVELALRGDKYIPGTLQAFQLLERSGGAIDTRSTFSPAGNSAARPDERTNEPRNCAGTAPFRGNYQKPRQRHSSPF